MCKDCARNSPGCVDDRTQDSPGMWRRNFSKSSQPHFIPSRDVSPFMEVQIEKQIHFQTRNANKTKKQNEKTKRKNKTKKQNEKTKRKNRSTSKSALKLAQFNPTTTTHNFPGQGETPRLWSETHWNFVALTFSCSVAGLTQYIEFEQTTPITKGLRTWIGVAPRSHGL